MPTPRILYSEEVAKNLPSYFRTEQANNLLNNLKTLQANKTPLLGLQETVAYGRGWYLIRDKFNKDAIYKDSKTFAIIPIPYKIHELRSDFSDTAKISTSRPVHPTVFGWDIGELENPISSYNETDDSQTGVIMNYFQPHLLINSIKQVYKLGGVNTICWHCSNPSNNAKFMETDYISNNPVSKILGVKNGTFNDKKSKDTYSLFNKWLTYAIDFFKQLVDENNIPIPIIFRPLHEGNINDFWWGGSNCTPADYIEFWQYIVDKFKDAKLYNVLFAYSVNDIYGEDLSKAFNKTDFEKVFDERYPDKTQNGYVDILGVDFYRKQHTVNAKSAYLQKQTFYANCLKSLSKQYSKVAAITETGIQTLDSSNHNSNDFIDVYENFFINKELAYTHFWRNDKDRNSIEYYSIYPKYYTTDLDIKKDSNLYKFLTNIKTKFLSNWLSKRLYGKTLIFFLFFSMSAFGQMTKKDSSNYILNFKDKPDCWPRFENFNIDSFLLALKIDTTITLKQLKSIKIKNGKYYFYNKDYQENEEFASCNKIIPKNYSPFPNGEENPRNISYCISNNRGNLDAIVNYKKIDIVGDTCKYELECARILLPSYPDTVFQILIPIYNFTELNIAKLIFLLQEHEYHFQYGYYHFISTYNEKDCNGKDKHPKMQKVLPKHKWPVKNSEEVFSAHTLKNNQLFVWDIWNPE
jgi:mannan endo-1,4-beta-mannosidase